MGKEYQAEERYQACAKALGVPGRFQEQVGGLGSSEDLEQRGLAFP